MNRQDEQFELEADLRKLDAELRRALPTAAPAGLNQRIYAATADQLPTPGEGPAVIGHIGPAWQTWVGFAVAAGISFALTAAIWLAAHESGPGDGSTNTVAASELTDSDLTNIALALDVSATNTMLNEELDDLESDLDALAGVLGGGSSESASLLDDLSNLESQLRQF